MMDWWSGEIVPIAWRLRSFRSVGIAAGRHFLRRAIDWVPVDVELPADDDALFGP